MENGLAVGPCTRLQLLFSYLTRPENFFKQTTIRNLPLKEQFRARFHQTHPGQDNSNPKASHEKQVTSWVAIYALDKKNPVASTSFHLQSALGDSLYVLWRRWLGLHLSVASALVGWWPRRGQRNLSNGMRRMDWPCSITMRPIGSNARMSMDCDAQLGLAGYLSIGHLTYGVRWAQCTGLQSQ